MTSAEDLRLAEDATRARNWSRWGPYLAERQWGTVREDYSATGECWTYFPHDHARSRAYRWGEDGLLGITDRECRLCFALALWNGVDPIVKERLFGLTGPEGNHGEDVKECYYYLDGTPTGSFLEALYKYPQRAFPYEELVRVNRDRGRSAPEYELLDTGVFDDDRYFDVRIEYAKGTPNDIAIRITVANRGPEPARLHVVPTLWFRNTWSWGRTGDGYWPKPEIVATSAGAARAWHDSLGAFVLRTEPVAGVAAPALLFTENETNFERLYDVPNAGPFVKDGIDRYVRLGEEAAVNHERGTRLGVHHVLDVPARGEIVLRLRLHAETETPATPFGAAFDALLARRRAEADAFYAARIPETATPDERRVMRQGYAGLVWSRQFYEYDVSEWLDGDPAYAPPPASRRVGRNADWRHLDARDVLSMPDCWEYPWFASWDLAFHVLPLARIDPESAKRQMVLLLREWYMHPGGALPAYEFAFNDVNPPVHAWACWRLYKSTAAAGVRDRVFLERAFQKLVFNFAWWVNRKDLEGNHLFSGGFLGLDNVGVFDRSQPLPTGGVLEQADGTAWMAVYCGTMLSMALELARDDPVYEDVASKFFEHFIAIVDAMNAIGDEGLWDEEDGFYYDDLHVDGRVVALRIRSVVGLIPLLACEILSHDVLERLPDFAKRTRWFLEHRPELARHVWHGRGGQGGTLTPGDENLLSVVGQRRLRRILRYVLDESEFLSPHGIRSLSRVHAERPYVFHVGAAEYRVAYDPAESTSGVFGGNSNWRGPVWLPINYLLIEALERYHHFYGDALRVELPTGSGREATLREVADELSRRLTSLVLADASGRRPAHGDERRYAEDPHWRDLVLFHEYFDGDTGRGLGASHQTGWTALLVRLIEDRARARGAPATWQPRASLHLPLHG